jgi:alkanesulfonate monooxygenase SsuD/methylene tetrahydromethanopterin reductase-like flavin-dependent oxidoreductase (luciferase family)
VSAETARWVGGWADGLITINQPPDTLRRVFDAFREGGGDGKPICLQVHLSWAADEAAALQVAHEQWRTNVFPSSLCWDLEFPEQFDAAARYVEPDDVRSSVRVSADLGRHTAWLEEDMALGVDEVYLHHVGQDPHQAAFIETFGGKVLPALRGGGRA